MTWTTGASFRRFSRHANDQVSCAFLLALETGMRAGAILSLTWGNVDLERRTATLPKTKNGDSRQVPLSNLAVNIFANMSNGVLDASVGNLVRPDPSAKPFTVTSKSLDVLFRRARDAAVHACPSIATCRFHDARSEAISRLSKRLDVLELARMVGHRDLKSLMSYFRVSAEDLAKKLG